MSYVRSDIQRLTGYVPGEQPQEDGWVKLNTNENPYPPSPAVREAAARELDRLAKYPDPASTALRRAAAEVYGVAPDMVIAGNGSDDILNLVIRAAAGEGEIVAGFTPSYTLYETLAAIQGASYKAIPFTDDFGLPERMDLTGVRALFLPNPNAPSGTLLPEDAVRALCRRCRGLVVIDEAYADFAEASAIPLLAEHPNLVVTRTFSKSYSLAGLRVGLGFAPAGVVAELMKVKDSYNLDRVAQAAAVAALGDGETLRRNVARIVATRGRLTEGLEAAGADVLPSQANFVLARFVDPPAREVFAGLKERRILVRYFDAPGLDDRLRITVGTDEEIDALLDALREILPG